MQGGACTAYYWTSPETCETRNNLTEALLYFSFLKVLRYSYSPVMGAVAMAGAAAGTLLAGVGIYKGGQGAERAGRKVGNLADRTGEILNEIRGDVRDIKVFLKDKVEKVWPDIEHILNQTQSVLHRAEDFLVMGTLMVKVLTLVFALCAFYLTSQLLSKNRRRRNMFLEEFLLQIIHSLSLVSALILALLIVSDIFNVALPDNIPFIVIIPSLATVFAMLQSVKVIICTILAMLHYLIYVTILLPLNMIIHPASQGSKYVSQSYTLLSASVFVFNAVLYCFITYVPVQIFVHEIIKRDTSILIKILFGYVTFYVTSVVTYILGQIILSYGIKPLWGWFARRRFR